MPQPMHTHNAQRPALALSPIGPDTACAHLVGRAATSFLLRDLALNTPSRRPDRCEATRKPRAPRTVGYSPRPSLRHHQRVSMSRAPTAANRTVARPDPGPAPFALLGGAEQQERVFAALRASLAHEELPALDADVRALLPTMTWAQIAQTMRVTGSSEWRQGLTVATTAMPHHVLWLLVGGEAPSPRLIKDGYHRALVGALVSKVETRFEKEAKAEGKRAATVSGTAYNLLAARATVARLLPWSAPADLPALRALMADPAGASAALGAALLAADQGKLQPWLRLWVRRVRLCPTHEQALLFTLTLAPHPSTGGRGG